MGIARKLADLLDNEVDALQVKRAAIKELSIKVEQLENK